MLNRCYNRVVSFDNNSIKNINPEVTEFKKRDSLYYSFEQTEENENLKGLLIKVMRKSQSKYFVLKGTYNSKKFEVTLGLFKEHFRCKQVRKVMDNLANKIRDDKLNWLFDPRRFIKGEVAEDKNIKELKRPIIREAIESMVIEQFPRLKSEGSLSQRYAQDNFRYLAGYNIRGRHIKFTEKNGDVEMTLRVNPIFNKLKGPKREKPIKSLQELFKKFPSGVGVLKKAKHYNGTGVTSLYDDPRSAQSISKLSRAWMKDYITKYEAYGTKRNCLRALKSLWYYCREKEWFQGITDPEVINQPGSHVIIKKPRELKNNASQYNKHYYSLQEMERIKRACFQLRDKYPFCCEVILLMMFTGRRFQEIIKLKKHFIDLGNEIILVPKTISKIREDQFISITEPVQTVLDSLDYQRNKEGHQIFNNIDWMFPTIRALQTNNIDPEYLNGYDTRMKTVHNAWQEIKVLADLEKGSLKSFRKTYSTHATKVFDGDTNKASKLTGHTRKETLERFYYQENQQEVIESAQKVAEIFKSKLN